MSAERAATGRRQRGLTLVELIMFIIIVGVGVAGILMVMNVATARSADPLPRKQALAIAESLLEEIELMPFTWCDPDDPNAVSANSTADCSPGMIENIGQEGAETRGGATPYDNVSDYHGYASAGITDITAAAVPGLGGYSVAVTVAAAALGAIPAADALLITVTVTMPGGDTIALQGYRSRYAPRAVP